MWRTCKKLVYILNSKLYIHCCYPKSTAQSYNISVKSHEMYSPGGKPNRYKSVNNEFLRMTFNIYCLSKYDSLTSWRTRSVPLLTTSPGDRYLPLQPHAHFPGYDIVSFTLSSCVPLTASSDDFVH